MADANDRPEHDAAASRRARSTPDVFSVVELDATEALLREMESDLAAAVAVAPRIPIPHAAGQGDADASVVVRIDLPLDVVDAIASELIDAEVAALDSGGRTTPEADRRGELASRWGRYLGWLDEPLDRRRE